MNPRLVLALLLPFAACGVQWLLWDGYIKPYVWFLFFPAAFFSAWLGGLRGGAAGTLIGALLVWYFYIPPRFSFELKDAAAGASIFLFVVMGGLFAWVFERLTQAMRRTDEALAATEAANRKITRLYQKTLELDELKSQFFANVSHELRTPLTLILAPLEKRLGMPGLLAEERQEAEMMLRNARLLYRHVSDLLDAAKLESGHMNIQYTRFDLVELSRALTAHFDSVAHERGIDYRIESPAMLPVEADAEKVQRILLNLLANAFKFTPDNGRIAVRLVQDDRLARIEVEDNGPGVPADLREAVFERFRQVEGGARRRHGGTGLGLAIVKDFVELHAGTVAIGETPGGGALFSVRLPLVAPEGTAMQDAAAQLDPVIDRQAVDELRTQHAEAVLRPEAAGSDAPLILVVEDNADMNAFIAASLRPRYRVASAFDGRAGLGKAISLVPDLILSDVMMPVMSGDEMVLELRRHPGMANVPIVMLTAKADDELRVRLFQAGVQGYLNKPFQVDELLARVAGLVTERQRANEQLRASEEQFRALVTASAEVIYQMSPDWTEMRHLVGRNFIVDTFEPRRNWLNTYIHPDDQPMVLATISEAISNKGMFELEHRVIRTDGSLGWTHSRAVPILNARGEITVWVGMASDVTARRQAFDEIKARNEELERFDRASVGRELQMIALKQQVNALAGELGREPPFDLAFAKPKDEAP